MSHHRNANPRLSAQWPGLVAKLHEAEGRRGKVDPDKITLQLYHPPITQPPNEVSSPDTSKVSQEGNTMDNVEEDNSGSKMQGSDSKEENTKDN
eukprot:6342770-Ditylum_brightwellii.AAC.1